MGRPCEKATQAATNRLHLCERDPGGRVTRKYTHGPTPIGGIGVIGRAKQASTGRVNLGHLE